MTSVDKVFIKARRKVVHINGETTVGKTLILPGFKRVDKIELSGWES